LGLFLLWLRYQKGTEVRGQRAEVGGRRSEVRGQKAEGRGKNKRDDWMNRMIPWGLDGKGKTPRLNTPCTIYQSYRAGLRDPVQQGKEDGGQPERR